MAKVGRPSGGNKFAGVDLSLKKETKVNKSAAKIQRIDMTPDDCQDYRCTCCGKHYKRQLNNFHVSNSPLFKGNNGYTSICKECVDKYYLNLVEFYTGNEEKAMERCCQILDWFYSSEAVAMTQKSLSSGRTRIGLYPSKMNLTQIKQKGQTYLDTIVGRANANIDSVEDLEALEEEEGSDISIEELKEDIKFFGAGYKKEEYIFLRTEYEDWTSRYDAKTKAQEELFKNLCIAQLQIQQSKQKGSSKDVSDAMKTFQDLLGSANLKPNQNNENALVEQNTLGSLIKKWEESEPIPEPSDEFKDVDGIKHYVLTYFNGHMAKMMNVENDFSKMYDEEISKYTVVRPQYEGEGLMEEDEDGGSEE